MTEHWKLIGYIPAIVFVIIGMLVAMINSLDVMDNTEHGIVGSCYTTVVVFAPIFSFVLCGLGIYIITSKLTWECAATAIMFFIVSAISFPVFFGIVDVCSMIGLI